MKVSRVHRLLRLITLMQSGERYDADALASELKVSRRTLFRDLDMLKLARVPYRFDVQTKGYSIDESFFLPPVNLAVPEALAALLVLRKAVNRQLLPGYEHAAMAAAKIEGSLPSAMLSHCGSMLDGVDIRWPPMSEAGAVSSIFAALQTAISDRRKVSITYDSYYEGEELTLVMHPYRLVFIARAWYAIGYSEHPDHQQPRTFKVDRILAVERADGHYDETDFDLDDYLGLAWQLIREGQVYHVKLIFESKVAGNVDEILWHATQQTERLDGGRLAFEVDVDGLGEISWWVLGYGDQVDVVEPPELRERIATVARNMVDRYSAAPGTDGL